jgi:hypothetical protein
MNPILEYAIGEVIEYKRKPKNNPNAAITDLQHSF